MRATLLVLGAGCLLSTLVPRPAAAQAGGTGVRRPVVMELFTSQGCSSCPPADAVVAGLVRDRADVLALTFHVTYWNNLGWRDPFSFPGATERQRRYVAASVSPNVYTPAMVVDGRQDVVGSDRPAVLAALARAQAGADAAIPVGVSRTAGGLAITLGDGAGAAAGAQPGRGTVLLVGYDREHRTQVGRGENGGRTLVEANVVRSIAPVGTWTGRSLRLDVAAPAGEEVAVIVQGDEGRILGAARP